VSVRPSRSAAFFFLRGRDSVHLLLSLRTPPFLLVHPKTILFLIISLSRTRSSRTLRRAGAQGLARRRRRGAEPQEEPEVAWSGLPIFPLLVRVSRWSRICRRPRGGARPKYVLSSARKLALFCDHMRARCVGLGARSNPCYVLAASGACRVYWGKLLESATQCENQPTSSSGEDLYVKAIHANEGPLSSGSDRAPMVARP